MKLNRMFKARYVVLVTMGAANLFLFQNCSNYQGQLSVDSVNGLMAMKDNLSADDGQNLGTLPCVENCDALDSTSGASGDENKDLVSGDENKDLVSGDENKDLVSGDENKDLVSGDDNKDLVSGDDNKDLVSGDENKEVVREKTASQKMNEACAAKYASGAEVVLEADRDKLVLTSKAVILSSASEKIIINQLEIKPDTIICGDIEVRELEPEDDEDDEGNGKGKGQLNLIFAQIKDGAFSGKLTTYSLVNNEKVELEEINGSFRSVRVNVNGVIQKVAKNGASKEPQVVPAPPAAQSKGKSTR